MFNRETEKLILSRKGFDFGSGGCPSPVFPDGTTFSSPIPSQEDETFEELQHGDADIASVAAGPTNGRMSGRNRVHFDPDINFNTHPHRKYQTAWQQWRGKLGQVGIAEKHLNKRGIGTGGIFLCFGLYRRVEENAQGWRWVRNATGTTRPVRLAAG